MTTQSNNNPRAYELGAKNEIPMIAADIIYEGSTVGIVKASGHARPLQVGDMFAGFSYEKQDNLSGSAAAIVARVLRRGAVELSVTGAVITDAGQPVYAADDNAFVFNPVGAVFIGFVKRFVSAGVVVVDYDADNYKDPYLAYGGVYEAITGPKTLDIQDNGKVFFVTATAVVTFPGVAIPVNCAVVNIGPYGTVQTSLDPAAADMIHAPDLAGANNKDHINTLATAQRGDLAQLRTGDANGLVVSNQIGIWAQEA